MQRFIRLVAFAVMGYTIIGVASYFTGNEAQAAKQAYDYCRDLQNISDSAQVVMESEEGIIPTDEEVGGSLYTPWDEDEEQWKTDTRMQYCQVIKKQITETGSIGKDVIGKLTYLMLHEEIDDYVRYDIYLTTADSLSQVVVLCQSDSKCQKRMLINVRNTLKDNIISSNTSNKPFESKFVPYMD